MKNLYCLFFLFILVACGPKAPTDEQLKDLCRDMAFALQNQSEKTSEDKAFEEVISAGEKSFDLKKITPEQVDLLFQTGGLMLENRLREWLFPVLGERVTLKGVEGAQAAYMRWVYFPQEGNEDIIKAEQLAYKQVLLHPLMYEFLSKDEKALMTVLDKASRLGGDRWVDMEIVETLRSLLNITLSGEAVFSSMGVFNAAIDTDKLSAAEKNEFREKVLKQYTMFYDGEHCIEGKLRKRVEEGIHYLQSPFAMGTLVGNEAPELDFIWISGGKEKNLSDLKGKVVLLDFWGTKCGPCLSIFPNMRELEKRYVGYPVEIVGVTSIMGYHMDVKNKRVIPTEGQPELEIELMRKFMEDMGMNWRVAFSKQNVMNQDYGVLGIPHIAILDAEGRVRYNAVNPFEAPCKKAEKIDILLKESGLKCPSQPMDTIDYSKKRKKEE